MKPALAALSLLCSGAAAQTPIYDIVAPAPGDGEGRTLCALDDLDADGVPDFALSAPLREITSGPNAGFEGVVEARSMRTGALLWSRENDQPGGAFGGRLVRIADVDADGIADIAVGDNGTPSGGMLRVGRVRILSGADGSTLREWFGTDVEQYFGSDIVGVPDRDGDGVDDLAVLSRRIFDFVLGSTVEVFSTSTGARLQRIDYFISAIAPARRVGRTLDLDGDGVEDWYVQVQRSGDVSAPIPGFVEVRSGATGALILELRGQFAGDEYGVAVLVAPDYDGDSVEDLVVVSQYRSTPSVISLGFDVRVTIVSGADQSTLHEFVRDPDNPDESSVVAELVGDLDGDGYPDLALGIPTSLDSASVLGRVEVLSLVTGLQIHEFTADPGARRFGNDLLAPGDVDLDGVPDLLAGASGDSFDIIAPGRVTLLPGPTDVRYSFCEPTTNSSGVRALAGATGTNSLAANDLVLEAEGVPPNQFGIFAVGTAPADPVTPPASSGALCLGGSLGRLNRFQEIVASGAAGRFELDVDLTDLPLRGAYQPATPGETLYFQAWFRDSSPGVSSGLSNGVAVAVRP